MPTQSSQDRVTLIKGRLGDIATEVVKTASAAEQAIWDEDMHGLREASQRLAVLGRQYQDAYLALLAADLSDVHGADVCSH